ncbi:hypothetical protein U9M48_041418 [Paspalum notatum var. saurae]|uniref:SANT domain-containing protein n=1 Tax=Paspalum notatum var. saurae TaxID=547442 RepID=A0AAQ3UNQ1_PASNO
MIDDVANFGNILDESEEEVLTAATKFRPKQRAKPRKSNPPSKSTAPNPTVETGDRNVRALNHIDSSKQITGQERASVTCPGTEAVDGITASQTIPETPSEDVLTVPLGPLAGASAADIISQDHAHNDDSSDLAALQENMVVSDIHASPPSSRGKNIDDIVEFGETLDVQTKEERAKFQPKVRAKLHKATTKSREINQKVGASTGDAVTQNGRDNNVQTILHDDQAQDLRSTPDSEGLLATDNSNASNLVNLDSILEESVQGETLAKFHPKLRPKPGNASSKVARTNDNVAAATLMVGTCADNNDVCTTPKDQETITFPAPQDVHATVDLDSPNELINPPIDGSQSMVEEVSVAPTSQSRPTVGREKDKSKSVSFALSDASVTPTDIDSEMCNFSNSCNDKLTDENVSNSSQQMAERHNITEEQYSNDQDCTDNDCWNQEVEPLDHAVEQQPESYVGETGSSMKLRSRKKMHKVPNNTADDYFGEDCVEPSLAEEDNDSGDDYTAGTKRKVRKRSMDGVEESQKQKAQKDKSKVSSRGRKRTSKDKLAEKPEKLTHRIRQRRTKEVKTLLETPREEIDPMKLSAAHLRLLQEARERVNPKQTPSGPSSNTSFGLEDIDDFDYRGEEAMNFDNERTDNHLQNAPKLNYHSYMNKPTRGKWSKSDTDLFYQGLRQFGSDFAMIQQLFPDKTRHQVRQKFKSEEKKNPLLVHDAIIHRSGDNQYFKKVIKQLNIEDAVLPEINNTNKQDGASSEGGPGNENVLDDFTNEDDFDFTTEGDGSNPQMSGVQEGHVSGNDDDLGDVFDWY